MFVFGAGGFLELCNITLKWNDGLRITDSPKILI